MRFLSFICLLVFYQSVYALHVTEKLPANFVYLRDIDPSIVQDIRYSGPHNFVGRPIKGYEANECILTRDAAMALAKVQKDLQNSSLSLKVYDCYRPTQAVNDFIKWSKTKNDDMKEEFYPNLKKSDLFRLGYISEQSGHSRGSTVDLTLMYTSAPPEPEYEPGQRLVDCTASYDMRFPDNSINMGTGYDCMDVLSHPNSHNVEIVARNHRMLLRNVMMKYGFLAYDKEWWHFTLKNEPYPNTYFDFPVK